jgi:hypothetical protein
MRPGAAVAMGPAPVASLAAELAALLTTDEAEFSAELMTSEIDEA